MSTFMPNICKYLREILLHYFIQNKSAAEAHRILVETYGDNALLDMTCRDWFRHFKNNAFKLEDKERCGAPKNVKTKNSRKYSTKTDLRRIRHKLISQLFQYV